METSNSMSAARILQGIAQYLEYKIDEGATGVEMPADVLTSLRAPPSSLSAEQELRKIACAIASCAKCALREGRTNTVPGQGSARPEIMFIGEGPGEEEDRQGLAFVGKAGQLLTRMIAGMGYAREQVFIGNVVKCRPPGNRAPMPDETAMCLPYLKAQVRILKPKVIIALGAVATRCLTNVDTGISRLRGTWLSFEGIDVMPTYHPAHLLRNESAKPDAWLDLQAVLKRLGRKIPPVKKRQ